MEQNKLIERFAEIQGISYEEAEKQIGAETDEEILANIQAVTTQMIIQKSQVKLNRAQRRALEKKLGKKKFAEVYDSNSEETVKILSDLVKKMDYIELIQRLREINEKKEKEENDSTI